jgi:ankyrin repeat protein
MNTYDIYELMITPPNKKAEMIIEEINKLEPNLNLVRDLITLGANLELRDDEGWSALFWCAFMNQPDIARMLIDAGADKTMPRNDGRVPYQLAHSQELIELLKV